MNKQGKLVNGKVVGGIEWVKTVLPDGTERQGYTWNPDNPPDGLNGPVGYNDFANKYMLNQFYLVTERVTKTDCCDPVDVGGRVDLLLQLGCASTSELDEVLDRIGNLTGVRASESLVHLSTKFDRAV